MLLAAGALPAVGLDAIGAGDCAGAQAFSNGSAMAPATMLADALKKVRRFNCCEVAESWSARRPRCASIAIRHPPGTVASFPWLGLCHA